MTDRRVSGQEGRERRAGGKGHRQRAEGKGERSEVGGQRAGGKGDWRLTID